MTESTTMEKEEIQSEQVREQEIEKSELLDSILNKLEEEFKVWSFLKRRLYSTTEAARTCLEVSPMPYKQAKGSYKEIVKFAEKNGVAYEFNPEELLFEMLTVLFGSGKLTEEERRFLKENRPVITNIVLRKLKRRSKGEKEEDLSHLLLPRMTRWVLEKAGSFIAPRADEHETIPRKDKIDWGNMHEFRMLMTDIFALAELARTSPKTFLSQFDGEAPDRPRTEKEVMEYHRRTSNIPRRTRFTGSAIQRDILDGEKKLLDRVNGIWLKNLRSYFKKERNVESCDFPERVKAVGDMTELFPILERLKQAPYSLTEENLHEINCAKIKLMIFLSATKVNEMAQYSRRESVKAYLDDYLLNDIFSDAREVVIGLDEKKGALIRANLTDPDTGEAVEVFLYRGGDSEHPGRGQSGVVNIKAMSELIMKRFANFLEGKKDPNPKDIFRITVTSLERSQEALDKIRRILRKTLTHEQSIEASSVHDDEHNQSSGYGDMNIKKTNVIISPHEVSREGKLLRGYVRDVKSPNRRTLIKIGPIDMEIRTGFLGDIIGERDEYDPISHIAYKQTRMLEAFNRMIPPQRYPENWIGRAYQELGKTRDSLDDGRVLPGLVTLYAQKIRNALRRTGSIRGA